MVWLCVGSKGQGRVLADRCLADVKTAGINARRPGEGIFKADACSSVEYCLSVHYFLPRATWLVGSFSVYILVPLVIGQKYKC